MKSFWLKIKSFSRLKKIVLGIFFSLSIIIALLSSLVSTQTGSHWVVQQLAGMVNVQLGVLKGNLLTGMDVTSVDYRKDELSVHAEKVSFRWEPVGLFYTSVNVKSFSAENIRIHLPSGKNEPEPENYVWPSLAQPVRIKLANLYLRNIVLWQGDTQLPINTIQGNLSLGTFHLRASHLSLDNNQAKIMINGAMGLRYPYSLDLTTRWQFDDKTIAPQAFAGTVKLTGDIKTFQLQQELTQPLIMNVTARVSPALHQPKVAPVAELRVDWPEQTLPAAWLDYVNFNKLPAQAVSGPGSTQGQVSMTGWLHSFTLKSQAQLSSATHKWVLAGVTRGGYDQAQSQVNANIESLNLLIQPLNKPDAGSNAVKLNGNLHGLNAWKWNLNLQTEHFNLNHFSDDWPSDLQLGVNLQGSYDANRKRGVNSGVVLDFNNINAQGELRGLAVSARGELKFDGENWHSSDANLSIGANQLLLKGQAGNALDVEWKLNAPLLAQIDPDLGGSIVSEGVLSGDKTNPNININTQINQFRWRGYAVENVSLNLKPTSKSGIYDLSLDAAHVQLQQHTISHLSIKGTGTLAQHLIDASVESPAIGNAKLKLASGWQNEIWRGEWKELSLDLKKIPRWSLARATPMEINIRGDKNRVDLGQLCLTTLAMPVLDKDALVAMNKAPGIEQKALQKTLEEVAQSGAVERERTASLCSSNQWKPDAGWQTTLDLSAVPASILQPWLKPEAAFGGTLDGQLQMQLPPAKPMVLNAHLKTNDVQLLYQFQGGNIETYPLQKGTLDATVRNDQATAGVLMDWGQYGAVNLTTKYGLKDKKLQATLSAALRDLAPLESLLPFLNDVQGSATANINITGTLEKPDIAGTIALNNGGANLPKLGLVLHDISLQINSQGGGVAQVDGQITSGDGTLMLKGSVEHLGTSQWSWQSNIYGADIRFIEQPQLVATVSPNLKLSATATAINLTGSTEIPWARATLKTLPASATRVSSDVTVIERQGLLSDSFSQRNSIPFFTNVILYFGDDVRFKGFGLDTQLLGKVNVIKEENRQTFTTGFVAVGKGNYKAYGQDLVIERGRLIFQGPYDNPGLDIRASRVLEDGTAGLEIGGTLQHPKSSVFAVPAASDSEAMAMLLTGKALSQSSQADAYSLIGAISSLGMDNGQMMTSDIAHRFHIDEISIKADKGLEQSALWMGKYLTPKLFIRYMVGLFDQAFSLGVRYQLNDKLRIEAESGKTQSVDVIYKIER